MDDAGHLEEEVPALTHRFSYTPFMAKIHRAVLGTALLCLTAGGCSQISVPIGSADMETPMVLTGSLPSSTDQAFADIEDGDRAVIAGTLTQILSAPAPETELAFTDVAAPVHKFSWTNPQTGNSGSISEIDQSTADATGCVGFRTTANTIAGIKLYSGTACKDVSQKLLITSLTVEAA